MVEPELIREWGDDRAVRRLRSAAAAARRVIIRKGLEATTLRDISREGGFTTGVLTHHFTDKRDLIVAAFAEASEGWITYARQELDAATTIEELIAAFLTVAVPDDAERRAEWRLWAEMWVYAGRDRKFAERLQVTDSQWADAVAMVLERCQMEGRLRPDLDVELEAVILSRLHDGLGLRAWLSGDWKLARVCLAQHLRTLGLESEVDAAELTRPSLREDKTGAEAT
jgi:AcrR family transcriptional regulator